MPTTVKTNGIIIRIKDTPGKDKLLTLLTETGLVTAFITPKRNAGKKSYTFDLFSYGEIVLYKTDSGNFLVNSITPSETFYSLRENITSLAAASYFATLAIHIAEDDDINKKQLLSFLLSAINKLAKGGDVKKIKPVFEFKITQLSGFSPCLEADEKSMTYYFDMDDGRLYASDSSKGFRVSRSIILCIYRILNADFDGVFDITVSDEEVDVLYSISQQYLLYHLERSFDSLEFLNGVI